MEENCYTNSAEYFKGNRGSQFLHAIRFVGALVNVLDTTSEVETLKYHSETRKLKLCVYYLKIIVMFFEQFGMEKKICQFFKDRSLNQALYVCIMKLIS